MPKPMVIRAAEDTLLGTIRATGVKNRASPRQMAQPTAVSPVLPPASTPAADWAYMVTVLVPMTVPTQVPTASTIKGFLISGKLPSSSSKLALEPIPNRLPTVEKKSPMKKARINGT